MDPIKIKNHDELQKMRRAGRIVRLVLNTLVDLVKPGISTAYLNEVALGICKKEGAIPLFLGYPSNKKGVAPFSGAICASVNSAVVHGIPNETPLLPCDILSIDFGCKVDGYCGDAAITLGVSDQTSLSAKKLLKVTEESLRLGIKEIKPGNRIGDLGYAIQSFVENHGYSVVRDFVGHGIGADMHEPPSIPNYGKKGHGRVFRAGMVLAVEPMVNIGTGDIKLLSDGWTAVTKDDSLSAHFEHTIAVLPAGCEILTV